MALNVFNKKIFGKFRLRTTLKMVQNRIEEGQNEFSSEAVTELIKVKNQA